MAKSKKAKQSGKAAIVVKIKRPITVEVIAPTFRPLASSSMLDAQRLGKGRHRIEIGFLDGGCCPKLLYAVIRDGMVTALEAEPCEDSEKVIPREMSNEVSAVVSEVQRKVGKDPGSRCRWENLCRIWPNSRGITRRAPEPARDVFICVCGTIACFAA